MMIQIEAQKITLMTKIAEFPDKILYTQNNKLKH